MTSYLASNIRYLRKRKGWSQEELANRLKIKRSNIAAYEIKNVRPRLDLVLAISKLFKVSIPELIEKDLTRVGAVEEGNAGALIESRNFVKSPDNQLFSIETQADLKAFAEKSAGIRKMLEGFKAFYRLRLENIGELSEDARLLAGDMENFLLLMDHLLTFNEVVIRTLSKDHPLPDKK